MTLSETGMDWLWNEAAGTYCSRDATTEESSGLVTNASFLALYAGVGSAAQRARLIAALERIAGSASDLIPSLEAAAARMFTSAIGAGRSGTAGHLGKDRV